MAEYLILNKNRAPSFLGGHSLQNTWQIQKMCLEVTEKRHSHSFLLIVPYVLEYAPSPLRSSCPFVYSMAIPETR